MLPLVPKWPTTALPLLLSLSFWTHLSRLTLKPFSDFHTIYNADDMQKILAQDTLGMFYGPMPVDEFFRFLPVAGDMLDSVRAADFSGVPDYDSNEKQAMYRPLVSTPQLSIVKFC